MENIALKNWCETLWNHDIILENKLSSVELAVKYGELIEEQMTITKDKMVKINIHDLVDPDPLSTIHRPLAMGSARRKHQ